MAFRVDQIIINGCYQTTGGEVRHVTNITANRGVVFTSHDMLERTGPVKGRQLTLATFADEAVKAVPCPAAP